MQQPPEPSAVLAGDRAALARAITLAEGTRPEQRRATARLLAALQPHHAARAAASRRVGITGSPGVGKSTLIEAYGRRLTAAGHRVAVLAVDPSSSRTSGSILGDKTRMPELSRDERAYVRPSPAGQTLGGVTRATHLTVVLCECAGYDRIVVETVGVGQSEHAVHALTDAMVLLVLPGAGDDLQGIKRGIVELADLVAVNKADGERLRAARDTAGEYRRALHLQPARADGWTPRCLTCSGVVDEGLTDLLDSVEAFFEHLGPAGVAARRRRQALAHFEREWTLAALDVLRRHPRLDTELAALRRGLDGGQLGAAVAAERFADALDRLLPHPEA